VVAFTRTSDIVALDCAVVLSPVTDAFDAATQLNVVPDTVDVNATPALTPEQIVCGLGVAVAIGIGSNTNGTVTALAQPTGVKVIS
jgi:hypothetical protein